MKPCCARRWTIPSKALTSLLLISLSAPILAQPVEEVKAAMRTATDFAFEKLANRGGFLWLRTLDLEPYGELKARPSMIWVEPPGTPAVGIMLLEAYKATEDPFYLERAREVAAALAAGQHPSGGWNYFIDFEPEGLPGYYREFFSKCWGWQEYLKQRDNCTFDDYSTTEPTRFFLRLHALTNDIEHEQVLRRALEHILRAQYPNGGWPQRFPLDNDYTAACTFNDDVMLDCILLLLEAHEVLKEDQFYAAARKGMDFYLTSQLDAPQAGWPQQCDPETLKPVWGRPFEAPAVCSVQTHENILDLFNFYKITGDQKYLEPVPKALEWLRVSQIPGAEAYTHTNFYELGSNTPVYIKQTGTTAEDVQYALTYEEEGCYPYAPRVSIPLDYLQQEWERLGKLSKAEAAQELQRARELQQLPEFVRGHYLALALQKAPAGTEPAIMSELDEQGGWRDEISLLDPFQPFTMPPRTIQAYTTGGYLARMYRLINFLNKTTQKR